MEEFTSFLWENPPAIIAAAVRTSDEPNKVPVDERSQLRRDVDGISNFREELSGFAVSTPEIPQCIIPKVYIYIYIYIYNM